MSEGEGENVNVAWSQRFVAELAASGISDACIAPGSRSTPLTLAFEQHPQIRVWLHLDERAASFFALGMALEAARPVALVCTSGTAAAEFLPAIIEARQSHVPLLILTSDRPHELRYSGANQTIDQVKMYGDQVLWSVDAALPHWDTPAVGLRNLRTLAGRAVACANGLLKGPVHINFPFRKPLEPAAGRLPSALIAPAPAVSFWHAAQAPTAMQIQDARDYVNTASHGLIVCGPGCLSAEFAGAVTQLAHLLGYPLVADPLSGVRFGPHTEGAPLIAAYETLFNRADLPQPPEVVIRFGAVPTSKWLNAYLDNDATAILHVRENGCWADDSHRVRAFFQCNETDFCLQLASTLEARPFPDWARRLLAAEDRFWQSARRELETTYFDASIVTTLFEALPDGARVMVGNSLPIRHVDQFASPSRTQIAVHANRGASGIDGVTSTALGLAAASAQPTVLLIGDISFFHDLTGLNAIRHHGLGNVTIVLLNNDGGSIFRRLPVAQIEPPFEKLFLTAHGLDFSQAAALFELEHVQVDDRDTFDAEFRDALHSERTHLIEVTTDGAEDLRRQRAFVAKMNDSGSTYD